MGCSDAVALWTAVGDRFPRERAMADRWRLVTEMSAPLRSMPALPVPTFDQAVQIVGPLSDAAVRECLLAGEVT